MFRHLYTWAPVQVCPVWVSLVSVENCCVVYLRLLMECWGPLIIHNAKFFYEISTLRVFAPGTAQHELS